MYRWEMYTLCIIDKQCVCVCCNVKVWPHLQIHYLHPMIIYTHTLDDVILHNHAKKFVLHCFRSGVLRLKNQLKFSFELSELVIGSDYQMYMVITLCGIYLCCCVMLWPTCVGGLVSLFVMFVHISLNGQTPSSPSRHVSIAACEYIWILIGPANTCHLHSLLSDCIYEYIVHIHYTYLVLC